MFTIISIQNQLDRPSKFNTITITNTFIAIRFLWHIINFIVEPQNIHNHEK